MTWRKADRCLYCGGPMMSVTESTTFRVGEEHVTVDQTYDACPAECIDDAGNPFTTVDPNSVEINEQRRDNAWVEKYEHPPPPPPPSVVVHARIPQVLADRLDRARGVQSRSLFIRLLLYEHLPD